MSNPLSHATAFTSDRYRTDSHVPMYQNLVDEIKESILNHTLLPGSQVDSISRIQNRYQVSRETAKRVLKILATEGYIIQRVGKGSFVADLRPKRRVWGVVLPFYSVQYEDLLQKLSIHAFNMGRELHHFIDHNNWQEEIRLVGKMIHDRYEAAIVIPTFDESETAEFYSRLTPQGTFVALMDHTMTGSYFSYVVQAYDLGVKRGASYLLDKVIAAGGGNIAFVRNPVWTGRDIIQEYMEATVKEIVAGRTGIVVVEQVSRLDADFFNKQKIRAIFCCNDTDAIRAIGRLREQGIAIPGQASLVSYGNTDLARYFTPAITSLDCHNEEMASLIARIMGMQIKGEDTAMHQYVVQPDLIIRGT